MIDLLLMVFGCLLHLVVVGKSAIHSASPHGYTYVCEGDPGVFQFEYPRGFANTVQALHVEKMSPDAKAIIYQSKGQDHIVNDPRAMFYWENDTYVDRLTFELHNITLTDDGKYEIMAFLTGTKSVDKEVELKVIKTTDCPEMENIERPIVSYRNNLSDATQIKNGTLELSQPGKVTMFVVIPAAEPPVHCTISTDNVRHDCTGATDKDSTCHAELYLGTKPTQVVNVTMNFLAYEPRTTQLYVHTKESNIQSATQILTPDIQPEYTTIVPLPSSSGASIVPKIVVIVIVPVVFVAIALVILLVCPKRIRKAPTKKDEEVSIEAFDLKNCPENQQNDKEPLFCKEIPDDTEHAPPRIPPENQENAKEPLLEIEAGDTGDATPRFQNRLSLEPDKNVDETNSVTETELHERAKRQPLTDSHAPDPSTSQTLAGIQPPPEETRNRVDVIIENTLHDLSFPNQCFNYVQKLVNEINDIASCQSTDVQTVIGEAKLLVPFLTKVMEQAKLSDKKDDEKNIKTMIKNLFLSNVANPRVLSNYDIVLEWANSVDKDEYIYSMLGLNKHQKLHLSDIMAINDKAVSSLLYQTILEHLIMLDCRSRDEIIDTFSKGQISGAKKEPTGTAPSKGKSLFSKSRTNTGKIHPMDALFACFQCSDILLKQQIVERLFLCRLAIPIVSHSPSPFGQACFNLSALRGLVSEWRENETAVEASIVNQPLRVVSFVRFGAIQISKSKLLNDIMSDIRHDTFYNRDCPQGRVKRQLTNGLVEAAFVFPTDSSNDPITHLSMFSNLRGDASEYKSMAQIMLDTSSYLFVFISLEWLIKQNNQYKQLTNFQQKTVHFLITATQDDEDNSERMSHFDTFTESCNEKCKVSLIFEDMNRAEMKDTLFDTLHEALPGCKTMTIVDLSKMFQSQGIRVDESEELVGKCKIEALKLVQKMPTKASNNYKNQVLPLQGTPWAEYVYLVRQTSRVHGRGRSVEAVDATHSMIPEKEKRKQQLKLLETVSQTFEDCLLRLKETVWLKDSSFEVQLKWYRLTVNNLALKILPTLRNEYARLLASINGAKQNHSDFKYIESLAENLAEIEKEINNSCFGIDHVLREIGQIYEAMAEVQVNPDKKLFDQQSLLEIGIKILLTGNPLELMNGEGANCHIPITWISAIINNLVSKVGDGKVFVVSIVGVQSSGKSTLLNAMFGIQFSVSAGRCTKGIYMQLVNVKQGASLPFDYVLIVDTEGLRDTELDKKTHNRDYELATMAIGLGDVTIVNVKGENNAEIQEILKLAVHVFLRMKAAKPNMKLHQKCIFVHQNVAITSGSEKLLQGRKKIQESLDMIAAETAQQEGIPKVSHFSDVIEFDSQKDVWYFPDLWMGNLPMAHVNPQYHVMVKTVKHHIFQNYGPSLSCISFTDLESRIVILWKAILSEDFVSSFKNAMKLKAYRKA